MTGITSLKANRLNSVQPSMILGLVQKARKLATDGHPVIDLGIGEPDFETPEHIKQTLLRLPTARRSLSTARKLKAF